MAPQRLDITPLNDKSQLAAMYQDHTIPEMADLLGCSINTIRNRFKEFGIQARNNGTGSHQTRIEKASLAIERHLSPFTPPEQAMILEPIIQALGGALVGPKTTCAICLQETGHRPWCSMASPVKERSEI